MSITELVRVYSQPAWGQASSFVVEPLEDLLLDLYPGATGAYSFRRLSKTYAGKAARLRTFDNSEQDIGFVGQHFDASSALSFIGIDSYTKALWHFEGNNGDSTGTGYVDSSGNGHTLTNGATGGTIGTGDFKFGKSGYDASSGSNDDFCYADGSSDFAFGTGDFTIEFWVKFTSLALPQWVYDSRPNATEGLYPTIYTDGTNLIYYTNSADRITSSAISTGTWYHVVVARSGTSTKMFLNGTQAGSTYSDSNNYINAANRPMFGRGVANGSSNCLVGYYDEARISKGIARWTSNFTAPVASYDGYVTTWYDQSGNGLDRSQSTGSAQPKLLLTTFGYDAFYNYSSLGDGHRACMRFDGIDDQMDFGAFSAYFASVSDSYILLVTMPIAMADAAGASIPVICDEFFGSIGGWYGLAAVGPSGSLPQGPYVSAWSFDTTLSATVENTQMCSAGEDHILEWETTSGSPEGKIHVTVDGCGDAGTDAVSNNTSATNRLAVDEASAFWMEVKFAEMVFWNARP